MTLQTAVCVHARVTLKTAVLLQAGVALEAGHLLKGGHLLHLLLAVQAAVLLQMRLGLWWLRH